MASARRRLSTEWTIATSGTVRSTLFRWICPIDMPADRQVAEFGGPVPKLLRPALAQIGAAGGDQGPNLIRPDVFRDGHQPHVVRPAAGPGGGSRHAAANLGDVFP